MKPRYGKKSKVKHIPKFLKGLARFLLQIPFGMTFGLVNTPPVPAIGSSFIPNNYGLIPNKGNSYFFDSVNQASVVEGLMPLHAGLSPISSPIKTPFYGFEPFVYPELPHSSNTLPSPETIHLLNLIDSQFAKVLTSRRGHLTDVHDDKKIHRHNTASANACYYINCRQLSHFCAAWERRSRQQRWEKTVDLPFTCGLHEVCCNLGNLDSTFAAVEAPISSISLGRRKCGHSTIGDGVIGRVKTLDHSSSETKFGEFPWQVAILKKEGSDNVYICAGSLIDENHVLTAAHCVEGYEASQLRTRLGEWDVNRDTEFYSHVEYDVIGVAIHPDYFAGNLMNDIAVVRMLYPVDMPKNPHILPICLPSLKSDFSGQRCWVSGWGKDDFGKSGKYQNLLKKVDVPILSRRTCQLILRETRLGPNYNLHKGMMCAGGTEKDACTGDGGGPLSCQDVDGSFVLIGIVSWGIGCGQKGVPGVYTNVEQYIPWITKMTDS